MCFNPRFKLKHRVSNAPFSIFDGFVVVRVEIMSPLILGNENLNTNKSHVDNKCLKEK